MDEDEKGTAIRPGRVRATMLLGAESDGPAGYVGEVSVEIHLDELPNHEWLGAFAQNTKGRPTPAGWEFPRIAKSHHDTVLRFTSTEDRMDADVQLVKTLIQDANQAYVERIIPAREEAQKQQDAEKKELDDIQARLDEKANKHSQQLD